MSDFTMNKVWLVYHPNPSKPTFRVPGGSIDAHCHVFGPGDAFPYAPERKYTPCDAPAEALRALDAAGVRGVRFNFVRRLADSVPRETLLGIAPRIAPLGWHVVIYFEAAELPELYDLFSFLPTIVVVDHMGRPDVRKPIDGPECRHPFSGAPISTRW